MLGGSHERHAWDIAYCLPGMRVALSLQLVMTLPDMHNELTSERPVGVPLLRIFSKGDRDASNSVS